MVGLRNFRIFIILRKDFIVFIEDVVKILGILYVMDVYREEVERILEE